MVPRGNPIRNLRRWQQVQSVLVRYGFDILLDNRRVHALRRRLRLSAGDFAGRSVPARVRLMLQELGPFYVKLGQIAASRSDLVPAEWVAELGQLRDQVAPFPYEQVRQVIVEELGAPPEEVFADFDPQPLAAASVAQVHNATLHGGQPVVVKVQRPDIEQQIRADIEMMREIARLAEARTNIGRQYGAVGIVDEFARTLADERDFRNEGRNADLLRRNMASLHGVHVPLIYWDYVTPRVLTMERVAGVRINDLAALDAAGIDRPALADLFTRSIFKQLLIDGFFHADPHPGNVFVDLNDGMLIFIDLGMMGRLAQEQREQLGDMVMAAMRRDSREIVRLVMSIGTPFRPVREPALRREVDRVLDHYLARSLAEISFSSLLNDILGIVFQQGVRLPSELTMAAKSLMQGEEVSRSLDPKIEIIEIARKVSQQILWQRLSPDALQASLFGGARELVRLRHLLPRALEKTLGQMDAGSLHLEMAAPILEKEVRHLEVIWDRLTAGLIVAGMAIASAIAMGVSPQRSWAFIPALGVLGFILSAGAGIVLVSGALWDWRRAGRRHRDE